MRHQAKIFISAVSSEFRETRRAVAELLESLGYEPIWQDEFPPNVKSVDEMLLERLAPCEAVVCLIGHGYGFEPRQRDIAQSRQSYTQMEYSIARELGKPTFVFFSTSLSAGDRSSRL